MGILLWVICCFSVAAFNIFTLCLFFVHLINMFIGVFHLGFILFGALWVSWTWVAISFPIIGKFSTIISSNIFSWPFFLSSSLGTPMNRMLGLLTLSQSSLVLASLLLILFFFLFFSSLLHLFPTFYLPSHLSYLLPHLFYCWLPPECFLSQLWHYSLLIESFLFLWVPCKLFSILVSRLFICNSILFSRFWIIFTIIILNSFSGRLPISFSFVWFGGLLSCSFTWWIFLCLFIFFKFLCLAWPFCMLEVCGSSLLWRLLPVGRVERVACQRFLVREACVGVLVGWSWISSLWSAMKCPVVSFVVCMGLVWLLVACSFVFRVMFQLCWRIIFICLPLKLVGSWVELGFSVGMKASWWAFHI